MAKKNVRSRVRVLVVLLVILVLAIAAYFAVQRYSADEIVTGNGAPRGAHYNLEVIGVPKAKTATITSGHRIFVPVEGTCKINLSMGVFSVLDGNCSDGSAASFQLPNPDPDGDGTTSYTVWARPLGKPAGKAIATTCATDLEGVQVCSLESSAFVRTKGKSSFTNVSKGFLTMLVDLDGDPSTAPVRLSIFDSALQDYFWNYDNNGLKNLQLRFYQQ